MNNPDICRYERELGKVVQGFHRRKKVLEAFRSSLPPLLEEIDPPEYEDLIEAFGPPEQMAQELLQVVQLPPPSRRKRIGVILGICVFVLCLGAGVFWRYHAPEEGILLAAPIDELEQITQDCYFSVDDPFTHTDSRWEQPRNKKGYCVQAHNTGAVRTDIAVQYSGRQKTHRFEVLPGETKTLIVKEACLGEHIVSFVTPDGSLSGAVRVLLLQGPS